MIADMIDAKRLLNEIKSMRIADEFRYLWLQRRAVLALKGRIGKEKLRDRRTVVWRMLSRGLISHRNIDETKVKVSLMNRKMKVVGAWRQFARYMRGEMYSHMRAIAHRSRYLQKIGWLVLVSHKDNQQANRHRQSVLMHKSLKAIYAHKENAYSVRDNSKMFRMTQNVNLLKKIMKVWKECSIAANFETSLKSRIFSQWKDASRESMELQNLAISIFQKSRVFSKLRRWASVSLQTRQRQEHLIREVSKFWTMQKWQRLQKSFAIWLVVVDQSKNLKHKTTLGLNFRIRQLQSRLMDLLKMNQACNIAKGIYSSSILRKTLVAMKVALDERKIRKQCADLHRIGRVRKVFFWHLKVKVRDSFQKVKQFEFIRLTKKCLRYLGRAVATRNGKIARMIILRNGLTLVKCFCSLVQHTNKQQDRSALFRGIHVQISSPDSCLFSSSNNLHSPVSLNY